MKRVIVLLSLYLIFLTYSLSMLFFGETGVYAFSALSSRIQKISENMRTLDMKEAELTQAIDSLRSDSAAMKIEARGMGLYEPRQQVVYFRDLEYSQTLPDAGQMLLFEPIQKNEQGFFRVLSLAVGAVFLLFGFIFLKVRDVSHSGRQ